MSGRHHDGAALKEQPHLSTSTTERGAKISHSQPLEGVGRVPGCEGRVPLSEKGTSPEWEGVAASKNPGGKHLKENQARPRKN